MACGAPSVIGAGGNGVPRDLAEMSLAQAVGLAKERAYAWSDLLDRRRDVLGRWDMFVTCRG